MLPTAALGLFLAIVLNSKIHGKGIYRMFLIMPSAMPPTLIGQLLSKSMFGEHPKMKRLSRSDESMATSYESVIDSYALKAAIMI